MLLACASWAASNALPVMGIPWQSSAVMLLSIHLQTFLSHKDLHIIFVGSPIYFDEFCGIYLVL